MMNISRPLILNIQPKVNVIIELVFINYLAILTSSEAVEGLNDDRISTGKWSDKKLFRTKI